MIFNIPENDQVILELYVPGLLTEATGGNKNAILDKITGSYRGSEFTILIRNSELSVSSIEHGPSVKIRKPTINNKKDIPIYPVRNDDGSYTAVIDRKVGNNTIKEIDKRYSYIKDFVEDNGDEINALWKCYNTDEFDDIKDSIIHNEKNAKYHLRGNKR